MSDLICDFRILRDLRKQENMSIADLSAQSGVSQSVISKLERNQTTAEMETLFRIARVFGLTLSDLISLAENRRAHKVSAVQYQSGDFRFDRISFNNLRCMHAVAEAGATVSSPELHRDDYELCWILKGELLFTLPEETHILSAGESIQFDALLPHTYKALRDSEIVIVHLQKGKRF